MPTAQEILNQVTGSDAYLSSALSGVGNVPQTYGSNYSPAYSGPSVTIPITDTPSLFDTFTNDMLHPLDNLKSIIGQVDNSVPALGKIDSAVGINPNTPGSGAAGAVASVGTLLGIVTDIPRVLTIIIGLLMLGAGLFILGARPVVNVVEGVRSAITP